MENEVLPCGCEKVFINGKYIWINCDEHEEEDVQEIRTSNKTYKMFYNQE